MLQGGGSVAVPHRAVREGPLDKVILEQKPEGREREVLEMWRSELTAGAENPCRGQVFDMSRRTEVEIKSEWYPGSQRASEVLLKP